MATAEEIRQRLAELNRDTAARTGPNPASESMRARMAASNRVVARDLAQNPASDSMRARMASLNRDTARTLRGVPTAPAGTQFTSPNAAAFSGTSAPAPRGAGLGNALNRAGGFLRQPVGPLMRTAGRGALGVGRMALGLPGLAAGAAYMAYQNRSGDAIAERTGLDDLQNRMISNDPEVSRAAVAEWRGSQQRGGVDGDPVMGDPTPMDGDVPVNSLRTADGRVLPVNPDAQVNTMSPENFTRIGSGLSQRLGDARLAAAERGDFGQLETDRAAFDGQMDTNRQIVADFEREQAMGLLGRSGGDISRRLRPVSRPEGSLARTAMASLGQLETGADRAAGLETAQVNANARREPAQDPLMSPSVIAERLRQEGADRRATGPNLMRGLEPLEDAAGRVTGFQGLNSQGMPVIIPQGELQILASQFQQLRQGGIVPPDESFADWVSRIQADTGQG